MNHATNVMSILAEFATVVVGVAAAVTLFDRFRRRKRVRRTRATESQLPEGWVETSDKQVIKARMKAVRLRDEFPHTVMWLLALTCVLGAAAAYFELIVSTDQRGFGGPAPRWFAALLTGLWTGMLVAFVFGYFTDRVSELARIRVSERERALIRIFMLVFMWLSIWLLLWNPLEWALLERLVPATAL